MFKAQENLRMETIWRQIEGMTDNGKTLTFKWVSGKKKHCPFPVRIGLWKKESFQRLVLPKVQLLPIWNGLNDGNDEKRETKTHFQSRARSEKKLKIEATTKTNIWLMVSWHAMANCHAKNRFLWSSFALHFPFTIKDNSITRKTFKWTALFLALSPSECSHVHSGFFCLLSVSRSRLSHQSSIGKCGQNRCHFVHWKPGVKLDNLKRVQNKMVKMRGGGFWLATKTSLAIRPSRRRPDFPSEKPADQWELVLTRHLFPNGQKWPERENSSGGKRGRRRRAKSGRTGQAKRGKEGSWPQVKQEEEKLFHLSS